MLKYVLKRIPHQGALALILFLSIVLLLIANYCGVGFTSDSYRYLSIADQIGQDGILSATGLNVKPPLYPFLVYLVGVNSILYLNVLCLCCSVSLLFFLGLELKSSTHRLLYWGFLLFSTPLYLVHSFAWTEPLFITLLLFAFYFIHINQQKETNRNLYIGITLLFLLPFVRFAGVFILAPTLFLLYREIPAKARYRAMGLIGLALAFYILWVINYSEGFVERWQTFIVPFKKGDPWHYTHNIISYLEGVSLWLMPLNIYKPLRLFGSGVLLGALGLTGYFYLKHKYKSLILSIPIIFLCYYFLLHFVFKVEYYSAERYLIPLYNLLILSLFYWYEYKVSITEKWLKKIILIAILALLAYNAVRSVKNIFFWNETRCAKIVDSASLEVKNKTCHSWQA